MEYYQLFIAITGEPVLVANVVNGEVCEIFRQAFALMDLVPEEQSICISAVQEIDLNV